MIGAILYLVPVSAAKILHPVPSQNHVHVHSTFHDIFWGNKHGDPDFFFQVFAKNSLIKNIFEEEKSLIAEHDFLGGK